MLLPNATTVQIRLASMLDCRLIRIPGDLHANQKRLALRDDGSNTEADHSLPVDTKTSTQVWLQRQESPVQLRGTD